MSAKRNLELNGGGESPPKVPRLEDNEEEDFEDAGTSSANSSAGSTSNDSSTSSSSDSSSDSDSDSDQEQDQEQEIENTTAGQPGELEIAYGEEVDGGHTGFVITESLSSSPTSQPPVHNPSGNLDLDLSESDSDHLDFLNVNDGNNGPVDPIFVDQDDSSHAAANLNLFDNVHQFDNDHEMGEDILAENDDGDAEEEFEDVMDMAQPPLPAEAAAACPMPPAPPPLPPSLPVDKQVSPPCPVTTSGQNASPHINDVTTTLNGQKHITDSESEDSFGDDELDELLNENVTVERSKEEKIVPSMEQEKIVLVEKNPSNISDVLPEDWIKTVHRSGMPIYLHRPTRVVSLTKPYFLGPGSIRVSK